MLQLNNGHKILTFGELMLRLSAPSHKKLFQVDVLETSFCGAEANVAVSLQLLGEETVFVSTFPNNDVGTAAKSELRYFGVDVSKINMKGKRLGTYYLEKGASQRSSKVIYDRAFSAFAFSKVADYNWHDLFDDVKWFHFTGINPALSEDMLIILQDACREAKRRGIIISCDLNFRSSLWSADEANRKMSLLMQYVDVCIANEEDCAKVFGFKAEKSDTDNGILLKEAYTDVAKQITDRFPCSHVAFTLRTSLSADDNKWAGMLYESATKKSFFSKEYLIHIVDRVGGGDSFAAGLIYALVNSYGQEDVINFAVAASCLKHSIEGDFNRTTKQEVLNLMNSNGSGRIIR